MPRRRPTDEEAAMSDDAPRIWSWPTRTGCPGSRRSRRTRATAGRRSPSWSPRSSSAWSRSASSSAACSGSAIAAQPGGNGEVIAAPEGDYKVRPDNPGGMNVAGEGDTASPPARAPSPRAISTSTPCPKRRSTAAAGRPAQRRRRAAPQRPAPAARRAPAPPPARAAPPPPAAGGATIQLGAFSSQAGANSAWTALSGRFRYLAPLSHRGAGPGRRPHPLPPARQRRRRRRRLPPAAGRRRGLPIVSGQLTLPGTAALL